MTEPQKTPEAGGTRYVVLRAGVARDEHPIPVREQWEFVAQGVGAASGADAIRTAVAKLPEADQAGTFVAVPERSFKPVRVSARVTTALVLEDVTP